MNIRDIARLADVTPGTVSKVLNNYPDISEATRQHVLKIIEENQYDPKANSRASRSAEAIRVGLVTEAVYNHIYSLIEYLLSRDIHNSGCIVESFHDNFYVQDKAEKLSELRGIAERGKWNGIIYIGGNFEKVPVEGFQSLPCPTVFVNTLLPVYVRDVYCSSVQVSHFETAFAQMRYLIDKGHREICTVISSFVDNSVYGRRCAAYQAALRQSGLDRSLEHFLESDYRSDKIHARLVPYLTDHPEITAVCCVCDEVVPGVLRAIYDSGRRPGADVDVIGFDGIDTLEFCIPSVTSFSQPVAEIVHCVYQQLFALINKTGTNQHITFRPAFHKGESA